ERPLDDANLDNLKRFRLIAEATVAATGDICNDVQNVAGSPESLDIGGIDFRPVGAIGTDLARQLEFLPRGPHLATNVNVTSRFDNDTLEFAGRPNGGRGNEFAFDELDFQSRPCGEGIERSLELDVDQVSFLEERSRVIRWECLAGRVEPFRIRRHED